ncbi:MAG: DUF484 family protein [Nitrospinae bacterium]|nr:DUF484 family protein [Nitrospinota bacterium]
MKQELSARALQMTNARLRESVASLKNKLKFLITCSEENEIKSQRIEEMEDVLAASGSMKELFDSLVVQGARVFEMDVITVTLDESLARLWPDEYKSGAGSFYLNSDNILFASMDSLKSTFSNLDAPVLRGSLKKGAAEFFPSQISGKVHSEALLPVSIGGRLHCVVAFGSRNAGRFTDGDGVRFLRRLSRTLVLRMEFLLMRENALDAEPASVMESAAPGL